MGWKRFLYIGGKLFKRIEMLREKNPQIDVLRIIRERLEIIICELEQGFFSVPRATVPDQAPAPAPKEYTHDIDPYTDHGLRVMVRTRSGEKKLSYFPYNGKRIKIIDIEMELDLHGLREMPMSWVDEDSLSVLKKKGWVEDGYWIKEAGL